MFFAYFTFLNYSCFFGDRKIFEWYRIRFHVILLLFRNGGLELSMRLDFKVLFVRLMFFA